MNDQVAEGLPQFRRELARGSVELAVLAVVASGPRYAYELFRELRQQGGEGLEVREGTLYPLLHRLEDGGLVSAEWEAGGRARPRKYYTLTDAGKGRLEALVREWNELAAAMARLLRTLE